MPIGEFWLRFRFVDWFAEKLTDIEQWGSSCWCHQQEWDDRVKVICNEKGRLLPWALEYSQAAFAAMLDEANNWTEAFWNDRRLFTISIIGCVSDTVARGRIKLAYLSKTPYIFRDLVYLWASGRRFSVNSTRLILQS